MSLREAYSLAHTAQCRLQMEATRPGRNLRFVVGHLMHYESLRLRIVEIEHDISKSPRATAVQFQGTGHVDHTLQHKPSTGQLGRKSPPPPPAAAAASTYSDEEDEEEDDIPDDILYDGEDTADLGLSRFPSGSFRPPIAPPDLEPDNADSDSDSDDSDEDEPASPEEPSSALIDECVKGKTNDLYTQMYEGLRQCPCHGKSDAPTLDKLWDLPPDQAHSKEGFTRAIAQVRGDQERV